MMFLIIFVFFLPFCASQTPCSCEDRVMLCTMMEAGVLSITDKMKCENMDSLTTNGGGVVSDVKVPVQWRENIHVILPRTTLTCGDVFKRFDTKYATLNGQACVHVTTTSPVVFKTERRRPPIFPVPVPENDNNNNNNDGDDGPGDDDDGDDDDYDDDEGNDGDGDNEGDENESKNTDGDDEDDVSSSTRQAATNATTPSTTMRIIVLHGQVQFGWGIAVAITIIIATGGLIVVIRLRLQIRRRREDQTIQLDDISSTSGTRFMDAPRSPRRRRSMSMESVCLYAVGEHKED